jgi:hypothetical protein
VCIDRGLKAAREGRIASDVEVKGGLRETPAGMKVVYTQDALADLDAILEFSAQLSSLGRSDADVVTARRQRPEFDVLCAPDSPHKGRPQRSLNGATLLHMKVEEIAEAVAKLPPDQLARFRRWFTAFEAGRTNHAEELDSVATKLGRLAGRALRELKRRAEEP